MGDRANILVRNDDADTGVWLYAHWDGYKLPEVLQRALAKRWRWDDCQYLTRIIFDEMTLGEQGKEMGYGISSKAWDGEQRVLVVNCEKQSVSVGDKNYSFEEFTTLPPEGLCWDC